MVEPVSAQIPGYSPQYQWYRGSVALADDGRITGSRTSELTIRNVRQGDIGEDYYCVVTGLCGSQTSQVGGLFVGEVTVVRGPQDVRVCVGQDAVLSVQVTSNIPGAVYSYRWMKDGQELSDGGVYSGTGTNVLTIRGVGQSEGGQYTVEVVANPGGAVASASGRVEVDEAPVITVEPEDVAVCEGQVAQMRVGASGGGLRYQWYVGGAALPGATEAQIEQTVVGAMDGLRVRCVVSNDCGEVSSREAVLTVKRQPVIVEQPVGGEVDRGRGIELRVVAEGEGLEYQWKKDGQAIAGATGSVYRIDNFSSSDVGVYVVEVRNECGVVVSSDVRVVLSAVEAEAMAAGYGLRVSPQPAQEQAMVMVHGPVGSAVVVEIVDVSGRVVGQVWRGQLGSGEQVVTTDVSRLASGVYRCVLRSGTYRLSAPFVIVR